MQGLRAAHLNQQVVVTGGDDGGTNYRDEVLCGILKLFVFYLAFFSRCFSTMLRRERGHQLQSLNGDGLPTPLLKSTLLMSVALVISRKENHHFVYKSISI